MFWISAHVILFYLIFAGGALLDIFVGIARAILFNEKSNPADAGEAFGWALPLRIGLTVAGAAGISLGLAVIMRSRRRLHMAMFLLALLVGLAFEAYALCALIGLA